MNLHEQPRLIIALAWLCLVTGILHALVGCRRPAPAAPAPRVVVERRACLDRAPPEPVEINLAGPSEGCPAPPFAGCLTRDQLIATVRYLERVRAWARAAWTACGPRPVPATGGPP